MRRVLLGLLLVLGALWPRPAEAACTITPNLGLCKPARGDLDWDVQLNNNFTLLDGAVLSTSAVLQTKAGTLRLGGLELSPMTLGSVLFVGATQAVTQDNAQFFWDDTNNRLGISTVTPGFSLDVNGTARVTGFRMATGAQNGYVLTSDGAGIATWQASGAGASGWTDAGAIVHLTTGTDKISLTGTTATEKLEVGGAIIVAGAVGTATGTIQWNGTRFQGRTASAWVNLDETTASAGGWTDNGTDIALTTSTDKLGIGAAFDADAKVLLNPGAEISALKISGYSLSGADASSLVTASGTWNTTGTVHLLDFALTDTASNAASTLFRFMVGGVNKGTLEKDGDLTGLKDVTASGKTTTATFQMTTTPTNGYVLTSDASGNGTWQAAGSGAIPVGLIALFDVACPSGWTRFLALDDKFPRGGATYGGTGGADTHTHSVDVGATTSTSAGGHTHSVDAPSTTSTSTGSHFHGTFNTGAGGTSGGQDTSFVDLAHTHSGTTDSAGAHTHDLNQRTVSTTTLDADVANGIVTNSAGAHTHTFTSGGANSSLNHRHSINASDTTTAGAHTHDTDISPFNTTSDGAHTHSVDPAAVTSATGSTLPAYLTMVFCKKN